MPKYAGKMNFYLAVLDDEIKSDLDNLSIGLILCKDKNKIVAEYSLKGMLKPICVSEHQLTDILPGDLKNTLPSTKDIEKKILKNYECK